MCSCSRWLPTPNSRPHPSRASLPLFAPPNKVPRWLWASAFRACQDLYYPGAAEEAVLENLDYCTRLDAGSSVCTRERWGGEAQEDYRLWRDSFGAGDVPRWGAQGTFGQDLLVEGTCKNMVALEAACPEGRILEGEALGRALTTMLATFFEDRTGDLRGREVDIRPEARLAGKTPHERIQALGEPAGDRAARELLRVLGVPPDLTHAVEREQRALAE